jgi:succinate dehydrogenase / fumarate reductase iron-sulfur subunit
MASSQQSRGKIVEYPVDGIEEDMSFLEMLDVLNEGLINKEIFQYLLTTIVAKEFAVLARCTSTVGGPDRRVPTCQLHMRMFKDGDTIFIEPLEQKRFQ